jgi:DNA-binding winged helix-turn-helix (wHTH) protein/TolB-like protein/tetratricopeptide (TPR) repeat protein
MESAVSSGQVFRFGQFEADAARNTLMRYGVRVKIQDQPFRVLLLLLERPDEIVSREELRQKLWPDGTFVDFDGSLNVVLKKLRAALDDDSENPRFIETVPRRGYRFIAPVSTPIAKSESGASPIAVEPIAPPVGENAELPAVSSRYRSLFKKPIAAGLIAFVLLGVGWFQYRKHSVGIPLDASANVLSRKSVAVLPFANEGAGPDFDFLRYAIADDLVTDLAYAHSVSVRPFASTTKYASQPFDPAAVGGELRVSYVLAGGFLLDNKSLRVNMELVDVARNQPVWRKSVTVSPQEMIKLHDKLAAIASQGLLPAMNVAGTSLAEIPSPQNEQALDLFLHSLSIPLDPKPNLLAIKKLEESVAINGSYAPAWQQLAWRYYMDFHYGNGGGAAIAKSLEASKHQSELDPDTPPVSITIHVEQGDLNAAYDQASEFLRRRPDSSLAHFWMSYVYRYAGLLDEATRECDAGLALDPGFNMLRSCAFPSIMAGDYAHAEPYIRLDENFGTWARLRIAIRTNNAPEVLKESREALQHGFSRADNRLSLFQTYLNHAPEPELRKAVAKVEDDPVAVLDHELFYQIAEDLAFCGQGDAALRQLRKSIEGGYCSYPALDEDLLFDPIRQRPEFAALRATAIRCQQAFLNHRKQVDAGISSAQ